MWGKGQQGSGLQLGEQSRRAGVPGPPSQGRESGFILRARSGRHVWKERQDSRGAFGAFCLRGASKCSRIERPEPHGSEDRGALYPAWRIRPRPSSADSYTEAGVPSPGARSCLRRGRGRHARWAELGVPPGPASASPPSLQTVASRLPGARALSPARSVSCLMPQAARGARWETAAQVRDRKPEWVAPSQRHPAAQAPSRPRPAGRPYLKGAGAASQSAAGVKGRCVAAQGPG